MSGGQKYLFYLLPFLLHYTYIGANIPNQFERIHYAVKCKSIMHVVLEDRKLTHKYISMEVDFNPKIVLLQTLTSVRFMID